MPWRNARLLNTYITRYWNNSCLCLCFRRSDDASWQCLTWYTEQTTNTNTMSCVPYMWQYCWKEISAVANIFYLVHCLLRHEITLHVLCRDKYSTSMQQYCHPGNNSYKHEPYSLGLYAHHRRQAQSNVK